MNPQHPSPPVESATLDWQDDVPVSVQFADVYFSRDDGAAETRYVFLLQNDLEQRWQAWKTPGSFTIGETGFGTGLNFFCAYDLWRQTRQAGQHLHFISVEKFPLQVDDLRRACQLRPAFKDIADALLQQYPPLLPGLHRLYFPTDNVTLTLVYDDACEGLAKVEGKVDAWFLDGFAPARNPLMWQPELFRQLARLSHAGTTFATFTSAGVVKRGLRQAGFSVHKHPGFGRKRDMLKGQLETVAEQTTWPASSQPWFRFNYQARPVGQVAVIGAGLAGCCAANALARRGWQVTVLEQAGQIASQASGNATGITYAKLTQHDTPQNRYYIGAYLYACRYIRALFDKEQLSEGQDWHFNGVLQMAYDVDEQQAQDDSRASGRWPDSVAHWLDSAASTALLGFATDFSALLMRNGGWLNPATLCRALLNHPGITLHTHCKVEHLLRYGEEWQLPGINQTYQTVVLANTFAASQFAETAYLPLRWVRGQVSHLPATAASLALRHAVNYDGYINPARDGFHCVGATFQPRDKDASERIDDHRHNLQQLQTALPSLAASFGSLDPATLQGRVGFRCQTPDFVPLVGPMPDLTAFNNTFADLANGKLQGEFAPCPYLPGLYITTAFGAKGITGAPLAGEILASYISGEPQPVDRDVLFALHPARFLQRALKRQRKQA